MLRHRGFPSRLKGTDFHYTLRREGKGGPTPLRARERYKDRRQPDREADAGFMEALWEHFGDAPFQRGNLDAGRLSWLFGREVVPAEEPFDAASYDALLRIDVEAMIRSFPELAGKVRP